MSIDLLAALERLRLRGVRLICSAISDNCLRSATGGEAKRCRQTSSSAAACSGTGVRAHASCFRRSDEAHFNSHMRLRDMNLLEALTPACALYPPAKSDVDWHIALSRRKRKLLNEEFQRRAAEKETGLILTIDGEFAYEIFRGTKLTGCSNTLKRLSAMELSCC
jgi:hypothetical protein